MGKFLRQFYFSGAWRVSRLLPLGDPRLAAIRDCNLIQVENAGHWVHHDQIELFLRETSAFLAADAS